jgi:hypothetical protein
LPQQKSAKGEQQKSAAGPSVHITIVTGGRAGECPPTRLDES